MVLDTVPQGVEEGHRDTELEREDSPDFVTELVREIVTVLLAQKLEDKVPLFDIVNVRVPDVVRETVGKIVPVAD